MELLHMHALQIYRVLRPRSAMGELGYLYRPSHPNPQILHLTLGDLTSTIKMLFPTPLPKRSSHEFEPLLATHAQPDCPAKARFYPCTRHPSNHVWLVQHAGQVLLLRKRGLQSPPQAVSSPAKPSSMPAVVLRWTKPDIIAMST